MMMMMMMMSMMALRINRVDFFGSAFSQVSGKKVRDKKTKFSLFCLLFPACVRAYRRVRIDDTVLRRAQNPFSKRDDDDGALKKE